MLNNNNLDKKTFIFFLLFKKVLERKIKSIITALEFRERERGMEIKKAHKAGPNY